LGFYRDNVIGSEIVLTLQRAESAEIVSIPINDRPVEDLLTKEWLLTNERGGYASSTIIGCNTRRYHGLLIGSLNPLANRIMGLVNCLEMVILNGKVFNLSTFEFNGKFAPEGFKYIKQFRRNTGVHFDYQLPLPSAGVVIPSKAGIKLTKSVYLLCDTDMVALVYDFTSVKKPMEFVLRPFIGLRDFHALQKSYAPLYSTQHSDGLLIRHNAPDSCELFLRCSSMNPVRNFITRNNMIPEGKISNGVNFRKDQQWWFNFVYRKDRERGQDFTEDLWSPGFFKCTINSPVKIALWANLSPAPIRREPKLNWCGTEIKGVCEDLHKRQNIVLATAKTKDKKLRTLCLAADQFIAKRIPDTKIGETNHEPRTTILAGFPWFADWGRDVFIALPGLLLSTGRHHEAKSVLTTFAQAVDEGMIPNRFDDYSDTAYFNSVDASLWFVNAAFQYFHATCDSETFMQQLLPTIRWIIDSYHNGTRFGIRADDDGLITAGNNETQLTWMDAKYDGVAITARYGKAVEVNALWYNSLCRLAEFYTKRRDIEAAEHYHIMAEKVKSSFCKLFWNGEAGYLNDCILPDGSADATLRPNQIFAVSLPFSPLARHKQASVVDAAQKNLLTPYGLRTLSAADGRYKGKYSGPQQQRDEAYHQGTVWPYLIGPFVEAYLKVNDFSRKSKRKAVEFIEPLMRHLTEDGCLGQLCEIFDGDAPHKPRGCIAQAWSVAELIRAYQLINS
jgi:predicted glycogen debranching enzyme